MLLARLNARAFISCHTARSFRMHSMQPVDQHPALISTESTWRPTSIDGQRVYVPQITASGTSTGEETHTSEIDPELMININTAGAAELELLPGIGPSLAKEIMDHRSANGLFNTADDLLAVSGIGPAKVEQIRDLITFH